MVFRDNKKVFIIDVSFHCLNKFIPDKVSKFFYRL